MTFLRNPDVPGFWPSCGWVRLVSYPMPLMLAICANHLHAVLLSSVNNLLPANSCMLEAALPTVEHAAGKSSITPYDEPHVLPQDHLVCSP